MVWTEIHACDDLKPEYNAIDWELLIVRSLSYIYYAWEFVKKKRVDLLYGN